MTALRCAAAGWCPVLRTGVLILAVMLGCELGFRVFEPFWDRLIPAREAKRFLYEGLLGSGTTIDRVFVGSSTAMMGIDPTVVDAVAGGSSFNAGQLGYSPPNLIYEVAEELVRARVARTIVYVADSWVANTELGSRPLIDNHGRSDHALWHFSVFRNRDVFFFWTRELVSGSFHSPTEAWRRHLTSSRRVAAFEEVRLWPNGYLQTLGSLNPDWPHFLQPGPPGTMQKATLRELFELCRARGVRLVVVRPPEYQRTYVEKQKEHAAFSEFLRAESEAYGFTFLDYSVEGAYPHADRQLFFDIHHLNHAGARLFSRMLGEALRSGERSG
jgi:hypothetical protein